MVEKIFRLRDSLNPPYNYCSDCYCCKEDVCASVIPSCNSAPIFDPVECIFDLITLFIQGLAIFGRVVASFAWWNAGLDTPGFQRSAIFITIIAFVTDHNAGLGQARVHDLCPNMIGSLACCQSHYDRLAIIVNNGVQFGVQPTFCAPNVARNIPFFARLQAVLCALMWVASICKVSGASSFPANLLNILSKTPNRLHRTNRL